MRCNSESSTALIYAHSVAMESEMNNSLETYCVEIFGVVSSLYDKIRESERDQTQVRGITA